MPTFVSMKDNEKLLLGLMGKVRKALPLDWKEQEVEGHREGSFSYGDMDKGLYEARPEIRSKTFFKKVIKYLKEDRPMREIEVIEVLNYLFIDLANPYGWPEVTAAIVEYQGGQFAYLLEPYGADEIDKAINALKAKIKALRKIKVAN